MDKSLPLPTIARLRREPPSKPATRSLPARGARRTGWFVARGLVFAAVAGLIVLLVRRPATGLALWWGLIVPLLPAVFLAAPGLWRNLCPLATSNQLPRWLGLTRGMTSQRLSAGAAYPVALGLFVGAVLARKGLLDASGPATAAMIGLALAGALAGGLLFKGKSGWCSTICPLLPVQRLYGQMPFIPVRHAHCEPCVGCAKNCFDVDPRSAQLADQYDRDRRHRSIRRLFAAAFPGFVLAYFLVPAPGSIGTAAMLGQTGLFVAVSLALFHLLDASLKSLRNALPAAFGILAFNLYYWFASPTLVGTLIDLGVPLEPSFAVAIRTAALGLGFVWLARVVADEGRYLDRQLRALRAGSVLPVPVVVETLMDRVPADRPPGDAALRLSVAFAGAPPEAPAGPAGPPVAAGPVGQPPAPGPVGQPVSPGPDGLPVSHRPVLQPGQSVLEALEAAGTPIRSGCRMGQCGADPVHVIEGGDALLPVGEDERRTLERGGCGHGTRLACMARAAGTATIGLRLGAAPAASASTSASASANPAVADAAVATAVGATPAGATGTQPLRLVIVGAGIAGATAATTARRLHPQARITLVGAERRTTYNRMAIASLLSEPAADDDLSIFSPGWFDALQISQKLGCEVVRIDPARRELLLTGGEAIGYDRLILATGARPWVPPIDGFDGNGTFVMRTQRDVIALRAFLGAAAASRALVVGAGLLGVEAARALREYGLQVTIASATPLLLERQADVASSRLLRERLAADRIGFIGPVEVAAVLRSAGGRVRGVRLRDGRVQCCDVVLVCAGVRPDVALAREAGITVGRGIVVDAAMRTSLPDVYAAGDAAELDGRCSGLWADAVAQAEVGATNAVRADDAAPVSYRPRPPVTVLKAAGIDFRSFGEACAQADGDLEIRDESAGSGRYRKLVLREGRLVGAILVDHPACAPAVAALVERQAPLATHVAALQAGDWSAVTGRVAESTSSGAPAAQRAPATAAAAA